MERIISNTILKLGNPSSFNPNSKKNIFYLWKYSGSYENPDYKIPLPHNECSPFYCKHIIPPILNWLNY